MKARVLIPVLALTLALSGGMGHAASVLKKLGTSPFSPGPLTSTQQLTEMMSTRQADLAEGFALAGASEMWSPLERQFPGLRVDRVRIPPGGTMLWMVFKKKGRVRVLKDVLWAGAAPFEAFRFFLDHQGRRHEFVVPLACGNIGLKAITPVPQAPAPPPEPKAPEVVKTPPPPPVNQPPRCRLEVTPQRLLAGLPIRFDAGASDDPDGRIARVLITVTDDEGKEVARRTVAEKPFSGQITLPSAGTYQVQATVTDEDGAQATSPECRRSVTVLRRGATLADVALLHMADPANYLALRMGYEYRFCSVFSLAGMLGFNPVIYGKDDTDAFSVDITGNLRSGRLFWGLGAGVFTSTENDRVDIVTNGGVRVHGDPEGFNASFFVEARCATDEFDDVNNHARYGFGLRFQF